MLHNCAKTLKRGKRLLCLVFLLVLTTTLMLPTHAELDEPVVLDRCESSTWHGSGGFDRNEFTEGKASVTWTVSVGGSFVVFRTWEQPVDASGANYLVFDFYVSDADMFYSISGGNSLEVTSSGTCDVEETAWDLTDFDVVSGWNTISLPLVGGGCDFSRVNYMRFYALSHNNESPYTIKLDHIRFEYIEDDDDDSDQAGSYIMGDETSESAVPTIPTQSGEDNNGTDDIYNSGIAYVITENNPFYLLGIILMCVALAALIALCVLIGKKKIKRSGVIAMAILIAVVFLGAVFCNLWTHTYSMTETGEVIDSVWNLRFGYFSYEYSCAYICFAALITLCVLIGKEKINRVGAVFVAILNLIPNLIYLFSSLIVYTSYEAYLRAMLLEGIVLMCVAVAALIALFVLIGKKKLHRSGVIFVAILTAILLLLGSSLFVRALRLRYDSWGDDPGTTSPNDAYDFSWGDYFLNGDIISTLPDQTGHPEVSADVVDVEELLRVDPNYSTKKDYRVTYTGEVATDYTDLPHIVMTETPSEQGILFRAVDPDNIQKMEIVGRDCWLFEHFREQKTNQFYVSLDDSLVDRYQGKVLRLNFITFVESKITFTVRYTDADGVEQTVVATGGNTSNVWVNAYVDLVNPSFDGSMDGYDFHITCTGPELIRIHAMYATEPVTHYISGQGQTNGSVGTIIGGNLVSGVVASLEQTGLIQSGYDQPYYIVAEENVRAYGALGDGFSNDTGAFLAAIEAAEKKGGGTVFVPAGYYCLNQTLTLPTNVALVGELETGTANGTVLCIYHGKGETNANHAAIIMNQQSSVQNIAFWYPEQTLVNGNFIPYPSTITQRGSEGVTVRNVTFVNAYFGINYGTLGSGQASNSLQYTRDIYGTCLYLGYHNDPSYDIGRLENFHFSPDFWLDSGLPGTPNETLLRTWMLRNSTGLLLQRIDWTYIADIYVDGYCKGIHTSRSSTGTPNGHVYNINLLDCYYPFYAEELSWMIASKCHFRAVGNSGATALYLDAACSGDMVFVDAVFESDGSNAIVNYGTSQLSLTSCTVTAKGTAYANMTGVAETLVNTTLTGGDDRDYATLQEEKVLSLPDVDYGKTVVCKPASTRFVNLTEAPYNAKANTDITMVLQEAIDDLKETGGMVYLPAGTYYVSDHIDIWAGVELRGIAIWAHSFTPTCIKTAFGHNDPDGEALFDLYDGAGMIGISVVYHEQNTNNLQPYSFTIRGKGSNIYLVNVTLPTSWNGVDFASYRCDEHYIEYMHGAFLHQGIVVGGGSENGIVRDCQFTPNCFAVHTDENWWNGPYISIMTQGTPFVVGESKNQILYHNFTYGAYQGLTITDGATDVYVLSHGVDSGDISAYFSGDCSVTLVNSELVNLFTKGEAKYFNYVYTEDDFTGTINFINVAGWGSCKNAFCLNGDGALNVTGAKISAAGSPLVSLNDSTTVTLIGLINNTRTTDFKCSAGSQSSIHITGNLFKSGLRFHSSITEFGTEITGADLDLYGKR